MKKGVSEEAFKATVHKLIQNDIIQSAMIKAQNAEIKNEISEHKRDLFIDMWNARGDYNIPQKGSSNYKDFLVVAKYDPINAPDQAHPFWINNLWLTYEEAIEVMNISDRVGETTNSFGIYSKARTMFPLKGSGSMCGFAGFMYYLETLRIMDYYIINNRNNPDTHVVSIDNTREFLKSSSKIREVIGKLYISSDAQNTHFYNCGNRYWPELETIWLGGIRYSFAFSVPKLKVECWEYMISNATNTSAITITVHADTYAKLTGDTTNEAAAALSEEEATQWQALVETAAAKNISFATA